MAGLVDLVIRSGAIVDGSGADPFEGDVVVRGDRIVSVGGAASARGRLEIDAQGLVVAPGFVNMLSWATESLLVDGRSMSDIVQGVTLEVFGEGTSMGPLTPAMRERIVAEQGDLRYDIEWTTLGEYLAHLERLGVSPNVASFAGASTLREHELGLAARRPRRGELARMVELADLAIADGAVGVGAALIYAPGSFADVGELAALASAAARHGAMFATHLRSEGLEIATAIDELLEIATLSGVAPEIYHLKALGAEARDAFAGLVGRLESARAAGVCVSADVYPYAASATGLDAAMPLWVQEGGVEKWISRLRDQAIAARVVTEMRDRRGGFENHLVLAESPDRVLLVGFRKDELKKYTGSTLADVARALDMTPEDAAIHLVVSDGSRIEAVYFNQTEDVVRAALALPWTAICSDAPSVAPEGIFLRSRPHPRAYGAFARVFARYVREGRVLTLPEAVRKMTSLPARNLGIPDRGRLAPRALADIVVFDHSTITDRATYDEPHQLAAGVHHVFVNGRHVIADGAHTGARPGRSVTRRRPTTRQRRVAPPAPNQAARGV